MDARDKSIIRQVAFKGAIELLAKSNEEWDEAAVIKDIEFLTDEFERIIHKTQEAK